MATKSTLETIKDRLDHAGSKADFDKLSAELGEMIHAEMVLHNPKLGEKELKERRLKEARILVDRMRARVDHIKTEQKAGKYKDGNEREVRHALERAETDLTNAEEALSRLV